MIELPVLPTSEGIVFPDMVVTVSLQSPEARQIFELAERQTEPLRVLLVPHIGGNFASVGVIATLEDRSITHDGVPSATLRAERRARVGTGVVGRTDGLWVEARPAPTTGPDAHLSSDQSNESISDLATNYRAIAAALIDKVGARRMIAMLPPVTDPEALADSIAYWPDLTIEQRLELLETIDLADRLRLATGWARAALAEIDIKAKIHKDVAEDLDKTQREAILRRQMAAIQSELAEIDGGEDGDAVTQYRSTLAKLVTDGHVTEATEAAIAKEIDRLERTGAESMEASWVRTWLDTVFQIPWAESDGADAPNLTEARRILDADHTGLEEVKDRLVEYLAVRRLRAERSAETTEDSDGDVGTGRAAGPRRSGAILALVGPPGVGKTSLGESVAAALGRKFVRVALGGIRDEAEIRGHRRTYVGARAGRLVSALTEAGTMNPVIMLDEIDKVSGGWQGDPSAALLEVLDPAQNHSFRDHYLEFELDLSDVVFIATANVLDTIPAPLLDRLEVIGLDGYTETEKTTIARDHLLPRLITANGLRPGEITVDEATLSEIVASYTREAGVRRLERQIDKLLRKAATNIATEQAEAPIAVTVEELDGLLGKPLPREDTTDRIDRPGIATGLAVTGAGGDVLYVETALVDAGTSGPGGVAAEPILTGQLGDVMKESATIVRSLVSGGEYSVPSDKRLHVHFPAGAVPKDGPSAGVTMTTALTSLLSGRRVRSDVAMTGEVSLSGRVLPIGGVKQKVLAAHRAGITTVLLPAGNGRDVEDIPAEVREAITIHLVADVDQVLAHALEPRA